MFGTMRPFQRTSVTDGVWFGDQLAVFRPNFFQNCEFRVFFVQNAKFRDFVRFRPKRISCVPSYKANCSQKISVFNFPFPFSVRLNKVVKSLTVFNSDFLIPYILKLKKADFAFMTKKYRSTRSRVSYSA